MLSLSRKLNLKVVPTVYLMKTCGLRKVRYLYPKCDLDTLWLARNALDAAKTPLTSALGFQGGMCMSGSDIA
jgi:hypothetical protein